MNQVAHLRTAPRDGAVGHLPSPRTSPPRLARRRDRIAVVGYGYWGPKHVRVLSTIPGVDVTIVDDVPARLAEAAVHHPSAWLAARLDDVLDSVDAVVIATPPTTHADLALRALEAGKATLVEKPLATSVEDAERLVTTAARQNTCLMVGHTFEYDPAVRMLRELVRSGELGRILYVDSARLSLGRYQSDVDVVWDLAPHDISIVSFLLDELPSGATGWAHSHIRGQHADVAHLRFDFPRSGTPAYVHVSWLSPRKVRQVTVVGERKMAVYDDMADDERIRIYDVGVDVQDVDAHTRPVAYRIGDVVSPYVPRHEPLLVQDEHFVDCLRTGRRPATPGERGLDVVRVLAATDELPDVPGADVVVGAAVATPISSAGGRS